MKIKQNVTKEEYIKLYPTGSSPRTFYNTAIIQKLSANQVVEELPPRPITCPLFSKDFVTI